MTDPETGTLLQNLRDDMWRRFDRLEDKIDKKVDSERVDKLERELDELRLNTLSQDSVGTMIGNALRDASTRGWTQKERFMYVGGFVILFINFLIGLLALGPDLFGGK